MTFTETVVAIKMIFVFTIARNFMLIHIKNFAYLILILFLLFVVMQLI
jgi:hypothetical protein